MKSFTLRLVAVFVVTAAATAGLTALLLNIHQRKLEARDAALRIAEIGEDTLDASVGGRTFPASMTAGFAPVTPTARDTAAARRYPIWTLSRRCEPSSPATPSAWITARNAATGTR